MTAFDNARLAIDSNFEINGLAACYFPSWPGEGQPCRVIPAQPDVEFALETARVQQVRSEFMLRSYAEGITPARHGVLEVAGIRYRIEELPVPDDLRLLWRLKCVKL